MAYSETDILNVQRDTMAYSETDIVNVQKDTVALTVKPVIIEPPHSSSLLLPTNLQSKCDLKACDSKH